MAQMNVAQFAKELGLASAMLLEQLQAAGIGKALADDGGGHVAFAESGYARELLKLRDDGLGLAGHFSGRD